MALVQCFLQDRGVAEVGFEGDVEDEVQAAIGTGELDERRYLNFQKLNAEQARNAQSLAERREQSRKTTKTYQSAIKRKRRRK